MRRRGDCARRSRPGTRTPGLAASPFDASARGVAWLALLAAFAGAIAPAGADDGDSVPPLRQPYKVRGARPAEYALVEARAALAAGEHARGVAALQRLLDAHAEDLVPVPGDARQTLWIAAPEAALREIEGMGEEGREAYETYATPLAEPLLRHATAERDEAGLLDLVRRFSACPTGVLAGRLLAESAAEAGRPRDAAAALRAVLRFAPNDADLWVRLVDALDAAQDGEALRDLVLPESTALATTADGEVAPAAHLAAARARRPVVDPGLDWPTLGGAPDRARAFPVEPGLGPLRWGSGVPLAIRKYDLPGNAFVPTETSPEELAQRNERCAPLFPARVGRHVVFSDGLSVASVDLLTGRRAWSFPGLRPIAGLDVPKQGVLLRGRTHLDLVHAPVVADGLVYAVLEVSHPYVPQVINPVEITTYIPERVIVALDLATGALRWRMGGTEADRAALGEISVASALVVSDGVVAAVGATTGDNMTFAMSLFALEARTGRLRWIRRSVVEGQQELNLFGRPVKEMFAGIPAAAHGVLYAPTGLGVLAAADLATGDLRWATSYESIPIERVQFWYATPLRFASFGPSPTLVHGDAVVVASPEAERISCFERATGRLRWRAEPDRPGLRGAVDYVLGVASDGTRDVVVTAGGRLRGICLADGRVAWTTPIEMGGARARGAVTATRVYVPTADGISRFSLPEEGRYVDALTWPRGGAPGNVFPFGPALVVTNRGADGGDSLGYPIQAFFDLAGLLRSAQTRRSASPADPAPALEIGDLHRIGGALPEAERAYEDAARLAKAAGDAEIEARARQGLFLAARERGTLAAAERERMSEARRAFEAALERTDDAIERLDVRRRLDAVLRILGAADERVANLRAMLAESGDVRETFDPSVGEALVRPALRLDLARMLHALGRDEAAIDELQRLLHEDGAEPLGEGTGAVAARREIDAILAAGGRAPYAAHEREAAAILRRAEEADDVASFRRVLEEYPNSEAAARATVGLAEREIGQGRPAEAARRLRAVLATSLDETATARTLAVLARALVAAGSPRSARATLGALERRHAAATFEVEGRPYTGASFAKEWSARIPAPAPAPPAETLSLKARPALSLEVDAPEPGARVVPVARETGDDAPAPLLVDIGSECVAIDSTTAAVRFRVPLERVERAARVGDLLVLAARDAIVALDPETGEERWRRPSGGAPLGLGAAQGLAVLLLADEGQGERARLLAIEVATAETAWTRPVGGGARPESREALLVGDDAVGVPLLRRGAGNVAAVTVEAYAVASGASTGSVTWLADGWLQPPFARVDGRTVVGWTREAGAGRLLAFDLPSGRVRWTRTIDDPTVRVSTILTDGTDVGALDLRMRLLTFGIEDGASRGNVVLAGGYAPLPYATPILGKDRIAALVRDGRFAALAVFDRSNGRVAWSAPLGLTGAGGALRRSGDVYAVVLSPLGGRARAQGPPSYRVLLVSADGAETQSLAGDAVVGYPQPDPLVEGGTLLLAGRSAVSAWK